MTKRIDTTFAKGSFFEDLIRFLKHRKFIRAQRTFCWCPICQEDLCSNGSLCQESVVNDIDQRTFCWCPICQEDLRSNGILCQESVVNDIDIVKYECENCYCRSAWDFGAPAPLLLRHDEIVYDKNI